MTIFLDPPSRHALRSLYGVAAIIAAVFAVLAFSCGCAEAPPPDLEPPAVVECPPAPDVPPAAPGTAAVPGTAEACPAPVVVYRYQPNPGGAFCTDTPPRVAVRHPAFRD